jgi:membrane protease YdiL (CAAX protease family)
MAETDRMRSTEQVTPRAGVGLLLPPRTPAWSRQRRVHRTGGVRVETVVAVSISVGMVVLGESLVVAGQLIAAELVHLLALGILLGGYLLWRRDPERRLLIALAPLPILRVVSIALPASLIPQLDWYVIIGIPVLFAITGAARVLHLDAPSLGLRRAPGGPQMTVALTGLVLGLPAYLIARPEPLVRDPTIISLIGAALVLLVFGGFLEELLFRGLIQTVASQLFGRGGVAFSAGATGLMYAGSLNPRYVVFSVLVAAFFGLGVRRTGSIAGATLGHGLLLLTQLVVWPLVLG